MAARLRLAVPMIPFLVLFLVAGSAFGQAPVGSQSDSAPVPSKVEAPKVPSTNQDPSNAAPVDPKTYVIGPEDILMVTVWREPDFTRPVAVRPDGKISMPLINDVQAEGLTPERLAAQLSQALSEYINRPEVSISISQVNSKKFYISGQVNRAGIYPLVVPVKVGDALSAAGGFRDFANTKNIVIMRGTERIKFNWNDYIKGKKLEQNIFLQNGDTILVP